jgi:hypothetical protein
VLKKVLPILLICSFFTSCGDDDVGVSAGTVPGLFIDWKLVSETVECPNEDPAVSQPQDEIVLMFRRGDVFRVEVNGSITLEGSAIFDGDNVFLTPSPFPNNFFGEVKWVFNGASLILNSNESKAAGDPEICSVRRVYDIRF